MNRNNHARNQRPQTGKGPRSQHHSNSFADDLKEIKAPYNFVPLSAWVHTPPWARQVSHDVPFRDGISGTIEYTLTAHTPLLVGNEQERESGQVGHVRPFRTPEGYAIPGTSLKGMIRSVMEIATFARMNQVDDKALSIRDLTGTTREIYGAKMTKTEGANTYRSLPRAGWLQFRDEAWQIVPCRFSRVEHDLLAALSDNAEWRRMPRMSAMEKYKKWTSNKKHPSLSVHFEADADESPQPHNGKRLIYSAVRRLGQGPLSGTLVFTGQPAPRVRREDPNYRGGTKHLEFVFWDTDAAPIAIPDEVMRGFMQVHSDSKEWAYWKAKSKVPVFYLTDENGAIISLGLSLMYRLPYRNTIGDAIAHTSHEHRKTVGPGGNELADFTTTLFGCADPDAGQSLKGRVSFSLALAREITGAIESRRVVLNSPKPSFFPNYIRQPSMNAGRLEGKTYATLIDDKPTLRGWKRYPARRELTESTQGTDSTSSLLYLLPSGTRFQGRIRVHNIRPEELGALLWVLTWGGNGELRHGLGMGKSLGYGQVSITIDGNVLRAHDGRMVDVNKAMRCFVAHMERAYGEAFGSGSWEQSDQIRALREMANPDNSLPLGNLILGKGRGNNQFVAAKEKGLVLKPAITLRGEPRLIKPSQSTTRDEPHAASTASTVLSQETTSWPPLPIKFDKGRPELRVDNHATNQTAFAEGQDVAPLLATLTEPQRKRLDKGKLHAIVHVVKRGGRNMRIVELKPVDPA